MSTITIAVAGGLGSTGEMAAQADAQRQVVINRVRIPDDTVRLLETQFRAQVPDGRYWYDNRSGAWGMEGGATLGFTLPGLPLGGPLPADISGRGTGVFINGREIHQLDLIGLVQLVGQVMPGRYWLDGEGNAGYEGYPAMANLRTLAQGLYRQGGGVGQNYGGGAGAYSNPNTGIGIITDGQGGAAVFGP